MDQKIIKWLKELDYTVEILPSLDPFEDQVKAVLNRHIYLLSKLKGKSFIKIATVFNDPVFFTGIKFADKEILKRAFLKTGRSFYENQINNFNFVNMKEETFVFDSLIIESSALFLEDLNPTKLHETLDKLRSVQNLFIQIYSAEFGEAPQKNANPAI